MPPSPFHSRTADRSRADADVDHDAEARATHTIPVVREEARVEKHVVDRGGVRVTTRLENRIERVDVPIVTEDAVVERVTINRPVPASDLPRVREEGDTLVIPVLDEEVVVERRYVLREEVRITRNRRLYPRTQDVLLQGQRVVVERHDAEGRLIAPTDTTNESPTNAGHPSRGDSGPTASFSTHQEKDR